MPKTILTAKVIERSFPAHFKRVDHSYTQSSRSTVAFWLQYND